MLKKFAQYTILFATLITGVFLAYQANAAVLWVDDPADCPTNDQVNYQGENCYDKNICGVNTSNHILCALTNLIPPPSAPSTSTVSVAPNFTNGGYLLNCYAPKDNTEPFCDNNTDLWCDRSETCFNTNHKETNCTAGLWASSTCGDCLDGWTDCDFDGVSCEISFGNTSGSNPNTVYDDCSAIICRDNYFDCTLGSDGLGGDANGCEVNSGVTICTTGEGLSGVYDGCTCVVGKQFFETNTQALYATSGPFLWGRNFGLGELIKFGNGTSEDVFSVSNDGVLRLATTTAPVDTTNRLYNIDGQLYWNGSAVGATSSGSYTDLSWINATSTGDTVLNNLIVTGTANFENITVNNLVATSATFTNMTSTESIFTNLLNAVTGIFENLTWANATSTGDTHLTNLFVTGNANFNTITSGSWQGSVIAPEFGGTGEDTSLWTGLVQVVGGQWSTTTISVNDLVGSSTLAYLNTDNTFSGNITVEGDLIVSSTVRTNQYCDKDGNNCFDPRSGWGAVSQLVTTTVTTTGNFSFNSKIGYQAANELCDERLTGSHFCFTGEIISLIAKGDISYFVGDAWIAEGPPGFTSNSNDCKGYTTSSIANLGAYWNYNSNGGGAGWLTSCGGAMPVSCCK